MQIRLRNANVIGLGFNSSGRCQYWAKYGTLLSMSNVTVTARQAFLLERWHQILNDPQLDQYESFRIETDGNGEILMSPRPPKSHNFKATKIATVLVKRLGGEAAVGPQIITS